MLCKRKQKTIIPTFVNIDILISLFKVLMLPGSRSLTSLNVALFFMLKRIAKIIVNTVSNEVYSPTNISNVLIILEIKPFMYPTQAIIANSKLIIILLLKKVAFILL